MLSSMGLAVFVRDLAQEGRVCVHDDDLGTVSAEGVSEDGGRRAGDRDQKLDLKAEIRDLDQRARAHAPARAPTLDLDAAAWAARRLQHVCFFSRDRKVRFAAVVATLDQPAPFAATPETVWSVDLFFRYLVDLRGLIRDLPADDAVQRAITEFGRRWPLTAVADEGVDLDVLATIQADPCLRRIHAERCARA